MSIVYDRKNGRSLCDYLALIYDFRGTFPPFAYHAGAAASVGKDARSPGDPPCSCPLPDPHSEHLGRVPQTSCIGDRSVRSALLYSMRSMMSSSSLMRSRSSRV